MLIVCTQDVEVRTAASSAASGAVHWGALTLCPPGVEAQATNAMASALFHLGDQEPLCFSAHGNDEEIGDETSTGWGWTAAQIVDVLNTHNRGYHGSILISACASRIVNFSARLAVALAGRRICRETWVYGYNRSLPAASPFPMPQRLAQQVDLQGTRVSY